MNSGQVYAKTPIGDEAVRQSTRVVQRNLRMVLVQVDGKLTVGELSAKIGNSRLVENAIRELESGGYVVPLAAAAAAWEMGQVQVRKEQVSAISQFSTFGTAKGPSSQGTESQASRFSSFGKPVLPVSPIETGKVPPPLVDEPEDFREPPLREGRSLPGIFLGLGLLLLLVVALGLLFYPYNNYKTDIEQAATEVLQQPVVVSDVSLRLLPAPHLLLQGVQLGKSGEGKIASLQIHAPWQALFGGLAGVERVTLIDPVFSVGDLLDFAAIAFGKRLSIPGLRQVSLSNLRLEVGPSMALGPLNGKLLFSDGRLENAALESPDRSLLVQALPAEAGLEMTLEGRAWRLPGLPVTFAALQAKGLLQADGLQISDIDTSFLGGLLKGDWRLSWRNGLSMAGTATLTRIDMRKLSSELGLAMNMEGDLGGSLRILGQGTDWVSLWQMASAQAGVEIVRGVVHGIDLGEAGRRGAGAVVRSGVTRFDKMDAELAIDAKGVSMRNIRLDAGLMTASGQLQVAPGGLVDGRLVLLARSSVATTRAPLVLSGQLPNLTVSADK